MGSRNGGFLRLAASGHGLSLPERGRVGQTESGSLGRLMDSNCWSGQEPGMYVVIVDIVAVLLMTGGIALVVKGAKAPSRAGEGDPGTYARRIVGTMIAAFGLAIGLMVT